MSNRLTRICTRTGDDGNTSLGGGARLPKDAAVMALLGSLDELNAALGLVLCEALPDDLDAVLRQLQQRLFDLGGELAQPQAQALQDADVSELETQLELWNQALPPLHEFMLPGPPRAAAAAHLARAIARRAERDAVTVHRLLPLRPPLLAWLNRLSDLLFVAARRLAAASGAPEPQWQQRRPRT